MKHRHALAALFGLPLVLAVSACSSSSAPASTPSPVNTPGARFPTVPAGTGFTAELVTDENGVHDRSFNQLAWEGIQQAHRQYRITPLLAQPKAAADYTSRLVRAAQHYATVTFAVGYGMGPAVYTAAQEFPRARFAIVDGRPLDANNNEVSMPNVENVLFKEQESGYLVGVIAGLMEKRRVSRTFHNVIGYIGGEQIPAVTRYLAGYVAGARSVDPSIKIVGDFAGSFTDPKVGATIASKQIGEGADILFQVAAETGTGYLQTVKDKGAYGIGVDASESYLGPFILTSAIKRVDVAVRLVIQQTRQGKFRGGDRLFGLREGATGFAAPSRAVPADIVAMADQVEQKIASGKIVPPTTLNQ